MKRYKLIVHAILEEYGLPRAGAHGVGHWARVLENGLQLAERTGANAEVVALFALFHDSGRMNERTDDGHGDRGALLAAELRHLYKLSADEFELLQLACSLHSDGLTCGDVTLQACWDADRLDLGRIGITPLRAQLCTDAAKHPGMLRWAHGRASFQVLPEFVLEAWELRLS